MTFITFTCDCGASRTLPVWNENNPPRLPQGWTESYARVRTGVPECPDCRENRAAEEELHRRHAERGGVGNPDPREFYGRLP